MIGVGAVWMVVSRVIAVVGVVFALFAVVWYAYIHDHAARTEAGLAVSVAREAPGDGDARCRERKGPGWRCTLGKRTFTVLPGKKNCWRAPARDLKGCVKIVDYVRGLL